MKAHPLQEEIFRSIRRLLSELNRDETTRSFGCLDRRFWSWKLVDFPEATFQRGVFPLAWAAEKYKDLDPEYNRMLRFAVVAGLSFTARIQHSDGSFDQAFPQEHSYGATAFLLHPLLEAFQTVSLDCSVETQQKIKSSLQKAAQYLCNYQETHGTITNHIAGAALSLYSAADFFQNNSFRIKADQILREILASQHSEGWYPEYEGADPGYQSLCVYYLAQIWKIRPSQELRQSLSSALDFLSCFIHPDGSFGGEYGSRRTAIYYPGGIAALAKDFPVARTMTQFMFRSISQKQTVTLDDMDMGNLVPLLSNYMLAFDEEQAEFEIEHDDLPHQKPDFERYFSTAGLYVRGTRHFYIILGINNGGVLKVFDVRKKTILWNDGGYVGELGSGAQITTQMTDPNRLARLEPGEVSLSAQFFRVLDSLPNPYTFTALRIINLTLMHSVAMGNFVKKILVGLLISGKKSTPLVLDRTIVIEETQIIIRDQVRNPGNIRLKKLRFGFPFISIHMATSRYFESSHASVPFFSPVCVDVKKLEINGKVNSEVLLCLDH